MNMSKKSVRIEPGCITCGLCEYLAPEIFEVTDVSHVKANAPIAEHVQEIAQAVRECPVQVIVYTPEKSE